MGLPCSLAMAEDFADYLLEHTIRESAPGAALELDGYELWVARDRRTDGHVTLALLPPALCENRALAELLERELLRMEEVHRGIEPTSLGAYELSAFGWVDNDRLFVTLESLEGQSLATHLHRVTRIAEAAALEWIRLLGRAVQALQRSGLGFCGSLRPELIWLSGAPDLHAPPGAEQVVRIVDLGVGRAIAQLQHHQRNRKNNSQYHVLFHGAPLYLAPEQCRGLGQVSAPSDVYALGALLFHLLHGGPPFPGEQPFVTLQRHMEHPPPLASLPVREDTRALLARMLAKEPEQRPTLDKLLAELTLLREAPSREPTQGAPRKAPSLGPYLLRRQLGEGGMARVFEAVHQQTGQRCAVKVLREECLHHERLRERFAIEVRAAQTVVHPGVVTILEAGVSDDNRPYLAMELIEGETLEERLRRGPLSLAEVLDIGRQVAEAVAEAHARKVIHRDLKPGNLMLVSDGPRLRARVLDFGIAKVADEYRLSQARRLLETQPGEMLGTLKYMAPEQRSDPGRVSDRADVYALGVTLYEMLCGKAPFSVDGVLVQMRSSGPVPPVPLLRQRPQLPPPVAALVDKMVLLNPEQRPTMEAVAQQLQLLQRPIVPRPQRVAVLAAALLLLLVSGAAWGGWLLSQRQRQAERQVLWTEVRALEEKESYVAALEQLGRLAGLHPTEDEEREAAQVAARLRCAEETRPLVACLSRAARPDGAAAEGLACYRRIPPCAAERKRAEAPRFEALRQRLLRERTAALMDARAAGRCKEAAELVAQLRGEDGQLADAQEKTPCSTPSPPPPLLPPHPPSGPREPLWMRVMNLLKADKRVAAWNLVKDQVRRREFTTNDPTWAKVWYYAGVAACGNVAPSDAAHALHQIQDVGNNEWSQRLLQHCRDKHQLVYVPEQRIFVRKSPTDP